VAHILVTAENKAKTYQHTVEQILVIGKKIKIQFYQHTIAYTLVTEENKAKTYQHTVEHLGNREENKATAYQQTVTHISCR
jgi:ribosomal protein L17